MAKKRNKKYTPRPAYAPPLVVCKLAETIVDLKSHVILMRLHEGTADAADFNWIVSSHRELAFGAREAGSAKMLAVCRITGETLSAIRIRCEDAGVFSCIGDEFDVLRAFVDIHAEFFRTNSGRVMVKANANFLAAVEAECATDQLCTGG